MCLGCQKRRIRDKQWGRTVSYRQPSIGRQFITEIKGHSNSSASFRMRPIDLRSVLIMHMHIFKLDWADPDQTGLDWVGLGWFVLKCTTLLFAVHRQAPYCSTLCLKVQHLLSCQCRSTTPYRIFSRRQHCSCCLTDHPTGDHLLGTDSSCM